MQVCALQISIHGRKPMFDLQSLLVNLAAVAGVPESIQKLIKFEMEVYGILPGDLDEDGNTADDSSDVTDRPESDLMPAGYDQTSLAEVLDRDNEETEENDQDLVEEWVPK